LAKYFLSYLRRVGDDYLRWACCDEKSGRVESHGHGSFADAASAAGRMKMVMVIAGTELLLEEVEVPGSNTSKALKAVPFALEEQLAQDIDASHFAFGTRLASGAVPVAVIARDSLDWIQDKCEDTGLRPGEIVPETLALPLEPERWTIMTNSGHAAVRTSATRGFSCDSDMLPFLLENVPEADTEQQIWDALHFACGDDRYELNTSERAIEMVSEVSLFGKGLRGKDPGRINLLQGDYSRRKKAEQTYKPWVTPAVLSLLLAGLWGGSSWFEYNSLGQQQALLKSEIDSSLKRAFPDVRRVVNPVAQMRTRVARLDGNGADASGFVAMIAAMGEALAEADKPAVRSMNFGRGKLVVDLDAASLQDLDKIKSKLESNPQLAAKVQSANKERERIRARLRVEIQS